MIVSAVIIARTRSRHARGKYADGFGLVSGRRTPTGTTRPGANHLDHAPAGGTLVDAYSIPSAWGSSSPQTVP